MRCVNIDWLEVFCYEDITLTPYTAEFFRSHGWSVVERPYGTRVYNEMFTLLGTDGEPLLEIRRNPKSQMADGQNGILAVNATHLRLCNRTCYCVDAIDRFRAFLAEYHYTIVRIARLDICLDFEYFDYGDEPFKFLQRYLVGRYAKINQANISLHGRDQWDGRYFNSVSWGAPKSCIKTRFYDKTMELREGKDKPYIRQAWQEAGLITDFHNMTKQKADGTVYTPRIWRVEFAITSGKRNWFMMEHDNRGKRKKQSVRHTLAMWDTKDKQLNMFLSLADHYFHFKKVEYKHKRNAITEDALATIAISQQAHKSLLMFTEEPQLQRKDRCQDKLLFRISDATEFYKLENLASSTPSSKPLNSLIRRLEEWRDKQYKSDIIRACNTIIKEMKTFAALQDTTNEWPVELLQQIRYVIAKRIEGSTQSLDEDRKEAECFNHVWASVIEE